MSAYDKLASLCEAKDRAAARIVWPSKAWEGRILEFARDVLGVRALEAMQRDVLIEFQDNPLAAEMLCFGQKRGKTRTMSICACYAIGVWIVRVWLYAPKIDHINAVLWPEIVKDLMGAYYPCDECMPAHRAWCALIERDPFDATPRPERCALCSPLIPSTLKNPKKPELGRVCEWLHLEDSEVGFTAPDGRTIRAYTSQKTGAKGGFSGPQVILADEASDINDKDEEAWWGNRVGASKHNPYRIVCAGNLLHAIGFLARAMRPNSEEGKKWKIFRGSSRMSPNCRGRITWPDGKTTTNNTTDPPINGLATKISVEEFIKTHSASVVAARIDAEPPTIIEGQIMPPNVVFEAMRRWRSIAPEEQGDGILQFGIDPARRIHRFAIAARRGDMVLEIQAEVLDQDTHHEGVRRAIEFIRKWRKPLERNPVVCIDMKGKEGDDFIKLLRAYAGEIEIKPINGGALPINRRQYYKYRDEIGYRVASWLRRGAIPEFPGLAEEMELQIAKKATVKLVNAEWQTAKLPDNEEVYKQLKRSPDAWDALKLSALILDPDEAKAITDALAEQPPEQKPLPEPTSPVPSSQQQSHSSGLGLFEHQETIYAEMWGR